MVLCGKIACISRMQASINDLAPLESCTLPGRNRSFQAVIPQLAKLP
jgi:hypothetical protein